MKIILEYQFKEHSVTVPLEYSSIEEAEWHFMDELTRTTSSFFEFCGVFFHTSDFKIDGEVFEVPHFQTLDDWFAKNMRTA